VDTTTPKLTGDRSQCTACGLLFTSTSSFDKHCTAGFTTDRRRCKTGDELRAAGWQPTERGFWRKALTAAQRAKIFTLRPSTTTTENNHHATR
jgi:hypothetical protein